MRPVSRGLSVSRPVAILSDNSVDHALLAYACRYVGIPVAPISQAYSLMSKDHAKVKATFALLPPGLVYGGDEAPAQVLAHANVRAAIAHGMRALRAGGGGSSTFAPRARSFGGDEISRLGSCCGSGVQSGAPLASWWR